MTDDVEAELRKIRKATEESNRLLEEIESVLRSIETNTGIAASRGALGGGPFGEPD